MDFAAVSYRCIKYNNDVFIVNGKIFIIKILKQKIESEIFPESP